EVHRPTPAQPNLDVEFGGQFRHFADHRQLSGGAFPIHDWQAMADAAKFGVVPYLSPLMPCATERGPSRGSALQSLRSLLSSRRDARVGDPEECQLIGGRPEQQLVPTDRVGVLLSGVTTDPVHPCGSNVHVDRVASTLGLTEIRSR